MDLRSAHHWAWELTEQALFDGAVAVDATLGNGYDTLQLCRKVGEKGHVYGFDIQQAAVDSTLSRLTENGMADRATLFCCGHQHMAERVPCPADAVMFNLGWLPGAPHGVTTLCETTLPAVNAALRILKEGGLLTICVYPGHEEGTREKHMLLDWAEKLDHRFYDAMVRQYLNQPEYPPLVIAVVRKRLSAKNRLKLQKETAESWSDGSRETYSEYEATYRDGSLKNECWRDR